jgi:hypothetical protein
MIMQRNFLLTKMFFETYSRLNVYLCASFKSKPVENDADEIALLKAKSSGEKRGRKQIEGLGQEVR